VNAADHQCVRSPSAAAAAPPSPHAPGPAARRASRRSAAPCSRGRCRSSPAPARRRGAARAGRPAPRAGCGRPLRSAHRPPRRCARCRRLLCSPGGVGGVEQVFCRFVGWLVGWSVNCRRRGAAHRSGPGKQLIHHRSPGARPTRPTHRTHLQRLPPHEPARRPRSLHRLPQLPERRLGSVGHVLPVAAAPLDLVQLRHDGVGHHRHRLEVGGCRARRAGCKGVADVTQQVQPAVREI